MWEKTRDRSGLFVLVLLGIELLRQAHYLISEHSSRYTGCGSTGSSAAANGSRGAG